MLVSFPRAPVQGLRGPTVLGDRFRLLRRLPSAVAPPAAPAAPPPLRFGPPLPLLAGAGCPHATSTALRGHRTARNGKKQHSNHGGPTRGREGGTGGQVQMNEMSAFQGFTLIMLMLLVFGPIVYLLTRPTVPRGSPPWPTVGSRRPAAEG